MYADTITQLIYNRVAEDISKALHNYIPVRETSHHIDSITVPLQADVQVVLKQNLGSFIIKSRYFHTGRNQYFNQEAVLSTRDLKNPINVEAIIDYTFEKAKENFKRSYFDGTLNEIIDELKLRR